MISVFEKGAHPPCPAPFNMAQYVLAHAPELGPKPALEVLHQDRAEIWSFAEILRAVSGLASAFRAAGLRSGDRILLRLGNTPETPLAYLAAIWADMVPVPTSAALTQIETTSIIAELDPKLVLHDPAVPCPDHPAKLDVGHLRDMMNTDPIDAVQGAPDRPGYIVYTSGTSGKPRAVEHAHRAIWARRMMLKDWYDLRPDDRLLHAGAFNWTFTMGTGLMDPWSIGATALIPAPATPPAALPDLLRKHKATMFAAAPGVLRKMVAGGEPLDLPDLRHGLCAGEKLGAATRAAWQTATGTQLHEAFGMSECSTFLSGSPTRPATPGATGSPQTGRHVAIVDETGAPQPIGKTGIIAVHRRDPGLMRGYIDAPLETAARYKGDWFLTGDEGCMDADGQITYLGRADDMMNAGGYRVSPLEIEAAFADFPKLASMAVTDIAVKEDVRVIMAFYTSDTALDPDDLLRHGATRLADYKCPREFIRLPDLPTGPNGKLARRSLQQHWNDRHG